MLNINVSPIEKNPFFLLYIDLTDNVNKKAWQTIMAVTVALFIYYIMGLLYVKIYCAH